MNPRIVRPIIVHPDGNPDQSFLVDRASVVGVANNGYNNKLSAVALHAIDIVNLRAGQFAGIDGYTYPRRCQLVAYGEMTVRDPLWRGIFPDAAAALLTMPLGFKTEVSPGRVLKYCRHAAGFKKWPFFIAWGWSYWQDLLRKGEDWPLERRWRAMIILGYPDSFAAFRQICSRLKLSVTKSGPNL